MRSGPGCAGGCCCCCWGGGGGSRPPSPPNPPAPPPAAAPAPSSDRGCFLGARSEGTRPIAVVVVGPVHADRRPVEHGPEQAERVGRLVDGAELDERVPLVRVVVHREDGRAAVGAEAADGQQAVGEELGDGDVRLAGRERADVEPPGVPGREHLGGLQGRGAGGVERDDGLLRRRVRGEPGGQAHGPRGLGRGGRRRGAARGVSVRVVGGKRGGLRGDGPAEGVVRAREPGRRDVEAHLPGGPAFRLRRRVLVVVVVLLLLLLLISFSSCGGASISAVVIAVETKRKGGGERECVRRGVGRRDGERRGREEEGD